MWPDGPDTWFQFKSVQPARFGPLSNSCMWTFVVVSICVPFQLEPSSLSTRASPPSSQPVKHHHFDPPTKDRWRRRGIRQGIPKKLPHPAAGVGGARAASEVCWERRARKKQVWLQGQGQGGLWQSSYRDLANPQRLSGILIGGEDWDY